MNLLNAQALAPAIIAPSGMWASLIMKVFGFIANYGWRIVVFTLILKLVISPLDFYQRYKMNKNQKITERLKPTMDKLRKQYAGDEKAFSQKQMELNRKEGYSYFSACLPMIITLVVFITMFTSMRTVSQYMTLDQYVTLHDQYTIVYERVLDETGDETKAHDVGQEVVYRLYYDGMNDDIRGEIKEKYAINNIVYTPPEGEDGSSVKPWLWDDGVVYDSVNESWGWIKNVWSPDVPWKSGNSFFGSGRAVLDWSSFKNAIGKYDEKVLEKMDENKVESFNHIMTDSEYNKVMGKLINDDSRDMTNGYLILPILVVLLSVGSQLLSTFQQKKAGQVDAKGGAGMSMKIMMFVMPVMMAFFALQSAAIFSLYMVTNSAVTLVFNLLFTGIIKLIDKRRGAKNYGIATTSRIVYGENSPIIHYVKGANPDAGKREPAAVGNNGATVKSVGKKQKQKQSRTTVVRDGRPDPHELMGYDMSDINKKNK